MNNLYSLFISLWLVSGCSFKIPHGKYTTASGPSFASYNFTFKENGRFIYNFSSDDGPPEIGQGSYVTIGKNLLLFFENVKSGDSEYFKNEINCTVQDSQDLNFKITETRGSPLIGVSIYNIDHDSQGTISQLDGMGQLRILKETNNRVFQLHYMGYEGLIVEVDGSKCFDIDIRLKEKIDRHARFEIKVAQLKREGGKMLIKMNNWQDFVTLYPRK